MKWAAAAAKSLTILRHPPISTPSIDVAVEISAVEEILYILRTVPFSSPKEAQLKLIAHKLTPNIVSAVIDEASSAPSEAFRFFVFASRRTRRRHLGNWIAHNKMIAIIQSQGGFDSAWEFLDKFMKNNSKSIPAPVPSRAFAVIISAYAISGVVEKAVEAFGKMQEFGCRPDTFTYNTVLRILVDNCVIILAMAVYNQMMKSGAVPNRATYIILMNGLCKTGKMQDAFLLFDEMLKRDITPDTMVYSVFLESLCKANKLEEAVNLIDIMSQSCKPDVVTYNILLSGLCRLGKMDEALERSKKFERDGFVFDSYGYGCVISGLFRAGRFEEACKLYEEMLEKNVASNCVVYTIVMKGYIGAGKVEEAFSLFNEMINKGVVPDAYCCNTLLKSLCDIGLLDRARSFFLENSQNNQFPNSTILFSTMICGLCKNGFLHEAQELYAEMQKLGYIPTLAASNALLNALCKAGNLKEARIHVCKMEMGEKPSLFLRLSQGSRRVHDVESLHQLVEELCMSGQVLKAYNLLRNIINSGVAPDIVTYNILINFLCKTRNIGGAMKLFEEIQLKGYFPDAVTYGTLINGLLKVDREEDASTVYQHMLQSGCSPSFSVYSILMKSLCKKQKVSQAVILWLNHLDQILPKEAECITAARKEFEQGNLGRMVKLLVEMDKKCSATDAFPYTIWLIGYCQVEQVDEALIIFKILREYNIDVTIPSCAFLINHLGRELRLASALDVMHYALDKGFHFERSIGNNLLEKLCKMNNDAARDLVLRMHLAGYDVDKYLCQVTKHLLYS